MIEKYFAKRIDINETLLLRKMSDEEIDNSEVQHYCDLIMQARLKGEIMDY